MTKTDTRIITNLNGEKILGKGEIMKNGDHKQLAENISVDAVPAYNTTLANTKFHPKGRDNGFVLSLDGFRIYIAGDTENIEELRKKAIAKVENIDMFFDKWYDKHHPNVTTWNGKPYDNKTIL